MHIAAVIFGLLIASLLGAAFHLFRGGGPGKLVLYILLSCVGFWLGHVISNQMGWTYLSIGPIRAGTAIPGSIIFLIIGYWLSLESSESDEK